MTLKKRHKNFSSLLPLKNSMKNLKETLARIVRDKNQREGKTLEDVIDE